MNKEEFVLHKDTIVTWINNKLIECIGPQDDTMLVDYIILMISNGKSSTEIAEDLEALVGDASTEISSRYVMI
mgnify:CR=1 FL=1